MTQFETGFGCAHWSVSKDIVNKQKKKQLKRIHTKLLQRKTCQSSSNKKKHALLLTVKRDKGF